MGILVKRSRRLAFLGVGVMAIGVALGVVPAAASAARHTARLGRLAAPAELTVPANVTWHKLKLINGWASSQKQDKSGAPAWAVKDGIVYLSGSMHQASGTKDTFAVLPKPERPSHWQYIGVYTNSDTYGQFTVQTNGDMWVNGPGSNTNPKGFTSLAGASFLEAHTSAAKLHLNSGWQAGPSVDDAGPPSYKLAGGVVHLSGEITHVSGSDLAFVLPKGARPAHWLYMIAETEDWAPGVVEIAPNGDVYLFNGNFNSLGDLDSISFSVGRSGWHRLHLRNGWISLQTRDHTGVPAYRVSKGVVYLTGGVRQGNSATSDLFTVLPRSARPAHTLFISTYNLAGAVGELEITPSGHVSAFGSSAWVFTSLAGISYPLGS